MEGNVYKGAAANGNGNGGGGGHRNLNENAAHRKLPARSSQKNKFDIQIEGLQLTEQQ